jgi:hypothetical protein
MVMQAVTRGAALLFSVLGLGACQFAGSLFDSTFPADVSQMTARIDLSTRIPAADAASFSISDVTAGGSEYLVLSSGLAAGGTRLLILDSGLTVLFSFTAQDIAGWGATLGSAPAKLDAMGHLVIGNLIFSTGAGGLVFPPTMYGGIPLTTGFESQTSGAYNFIDFSASGNNLTFSEYFDTWLFDGTWTFPVRATPGANTNFSVKGIFSDPDPSRQLAIIVLSDAGDSMDHYLVIPLSGLNGGSLSGPLQSFYEVFSRASTDGNLMGYSNGGLIRFVPGGIPGTGAFVRSDLGGTDQVRQLPYFRSLRTRQAFSPSGGTYFTFDLDSRVVTRLTAWWN